MQELLGLPQQNILFSVVVIGLVLIFAYILKKYREVVYYNELYECFLYSNKVKNAKVVSFEIFKREFEKIYWKYNITGDGLFYSDNNHIGDSEIYLNGRYILLTLEDFKRVDKYLNKFLKEGDYTVTTEGSKEEIRKSDFKFSL